MIAALDHVVIRAADLARTRDFYARVVGAEPRELPYGRLALRFGDAQVNVHVPGSTPHPVAAERAPAGAFDLCFRFEGTTNDALAHLGAAGVACELGPVARAGARGGPAQCGRRAVRGQRRAEHRGGHREGPRGARIGGGLREGGAIRARHEGAGQLR